MDYSHVLSISGPNCISPFKTLEAELGDLSTKLLLHYSPKVTGRGHRQSSKHSITVHTRPWAVHVHAVPFQTMMTRRDPRLCLSLAATGLQEHHLSGHVP